ncbi:MAG: pyridoxal-dependent decarboxylase, partial [Saprospiraceae bacterium]|nr:pyridoxal-dependent decarboxylase [Saprospiraceae bacterium]
GGYDGYVESWGTEAIFQALWVFRNFFQSNGAMPREICVLSSYETHYSVAKGAGILGIEPVLEDVDVYTRELLPDSLDRAIADALNRGKKYFIVVANMMTTMFGSVDDIDIYTATLERAGVPFVVHVDAAFGGFYYPFTEKDNHLDFSNPRVTSLTLDAHKMAQAPYGTGIFLIRKGWIAHTHTRQARYIEGEDSTLIGSRSGANAVAIWMILMKNGPFGWKEKIFILQKRTDWLCEQLDALDVQYYRHPGANLVTIRKEHMLPQIAHDFGLVPDDHHDPHWYKIVVMEHVLLENMIPLIGRLRQLTQLNASLSGA